MPVGMKNPTSGDYNVMLNSCVAAQAKHTFLFSGYETKTDGNELAHCILRGSLSKSGRSISNYHYEDLKLLCDMYQKFDKKSGVILGYGKKVGSAAAYCKRNTS